MSGPIKITVVTNATAARRDLTALSRTVATVGNVQPASFNKVKFARTYAGPAFSAYRLLFRKTNAARQQFDRDVATPAPIRTPGIRQAIRDYAALGGEARTTLADMNRRTTALEETSRKAYGTASSKLDDYKQTATGAVGKLKAIALATAGIGIASRGISAATGYLKTAVSAASDLNEQSSRTTQVFGKSSASVQAFAKTSAVALGQTSTQTLEAAGTYGNFLVNIGLTQKAAAKMSTQLLTTAGDLASFNNKSPADTLAAISSALAGEFDPLQSLGFAISATAVQNQALSDGLVKRVINQDKVKAATLRLSVAQTRYNAVLAKYGKNSTQARSALAGLVSSQSALKTAAAGTAGKLTAAQQAQATYNLILKQTGKATGDFSRTQNGLANSLRQNKAGLANISAQIGTALLPSMTALSIAFRDKVLPNLALLVDKYGPKVDAFFSRLASSGLPKVSAQLKTVDLGKPFKNLKPGDLDKATDSLGRIGSAFTELAGPTGTGLNDTLTVGSIAIKTLADHAGLLAKTMPLLITAYISYKGAVALASAAEVLKLPTKIAEIVVNRQLIASNRALIASRVSETTAVTGNIVAENTATVSKERGVIATVASRVATTASAAATGVLTVAQGALNAVMLLSPVTLVVVALVALAAIFVILYARSAKFRAVINGVFGALKTGVLATIGFVRANWPVILGVLTGPVGLAFRKYRTKIVAVFTSIKSNVVSIFHGIGDVISSALKAAVNSAIDLVNQPLKAISSISSKVPGVPDIPLIPKLATGGIVRARSGGTLALLAEGGHDEAVVPLNGKGFGGDTYITYLTVQAGIGNPVEIGRTAVQMIQSYERSKGRRLMSNEAA